ncbi:MAG: hypothetical protein JOY96_07385 [Verrucomicrobia bacterium]|nr:hypothetical protein [Verrucomicrobiota bacterium]
MRSNEPARISHGRLRHAFEAPPRLWTALLLTISAIYTAHVIQWSLRWGRLSMDPVFDDVGYLTDGLLRLNILQTRGFHEFCSSLVRQPPHSPWSTLVATFAFAVFGVHDWMAYVFNGVLLSAFLLMAWDCVNQGNHLVGALLVLTVLLLPISFEAVLEFRPDFAVAVFTAGFSLLLLKMGCWNFDRSFELQNHLVAGLLAGIAYLAKPTFFPHTTVMLLVAIFLAEIGRYYVSASDLNTRRILIRLLAVFLSTGVIAAPYFLTNWREMLNYLVVNTGSGKDAVLWKVPGGFFVALRSRLFGYPAELTLGRFTSTLTVWLMLGIGFSVIRRDRQSICFIAGGITLSALSLGITAAGDMADWHFSLAWTLLFVLTALYSVAQFCSYKATSFLPVAFCAIMAFNFYKAPPARNVWKVSSDTLRGSSLNQKIVRVFEKEAAGKPAVVYATFMGKVNAASQGWLALVDGANLTFLDRHRSGDEHEQVAGIEAADYVEIADPDSEWLDRWLPSAQVQSALTDKVRTLSDFVELQPVVGKEGKVFLFKKR